MGFVIKVNAWLFQYTNTFRATSVTEKLFKGPLQWRMTDNMEQYRRDLISFLQEEGIGKLKLSEGKSQAV